MSGEDGLEDKVNVIFGKPLSLKELTHMYNNISQSTHYEFHCFPDTYLIIGDINKKESVPIRSEDREFRGHIVTQNEKVDFVCYTAYIKDLGLRFRGMHLFKRYEFLDEVPSANKLIESVKKEINDFFRKNY